NMRCPEIMWDTDDAALRATYLRNSSDRDAPISSACRCKTISSYHSSLVSTLISSFFITDKKRSTRYRRDVHFSRTCNNHWVTDFREILRINAGAKIDSSRGKNIRAPASITAQRDTDDAAVSASLLSKICDLKEAIFRDCDREL